MNTNTVLRQQLANMLTQRQAHMLFEDAVKDFPEHAMNMKPNPLSYSFWHLLEHIRICQTDILDYIVNPDYVAPAFPAGYWLAEDQTCTPGEWKHTIQQFHDDRQALVDVVMNPENDLHAQIPHAQAGHNILREIIIVGQHNAYHIGEFGILRQVHNLWG